MKVAGVPRRRHISWPADVLREDADSKISHCLLHVNLQFADLFAQPVPLGLCLIGRAAT